MTDLPALIFFCLSAGRTRCITDFPSATIETQESSLALTCTKNAFSFAEMGASAESFGTGSGLGSADRELAVSCVGTCLAAVGESLFTVFTAGVGDVTGCEVGALACGSLTVLASAACCVFSTGAGLCGFDLIQKP